MNTRAPAWLDHERDRMLAEAERIPVLDAEHYDHPRKIVVWVAFGLAAWTATLGAAALVWRVM